MIDSLPIESYEVLQDDSEINLDPYVECAVTVKLECGVTLEGYVAVDLSGQPDWSTFEMMCVVGA